MDPTDLTVGIAMPESKAAGWEPRPRDKPTVKPAPPASPTGHAFLSVAAAYAMLMGPAVLLSGAIVLYILGALSPQSANSALGFAPHLQAALTAVALMAALVIARLYERRGLLGISSRLGPKAVGNLLYAAEILGYSSCLVALWRARDSDGFGPVGIAGMALAGATLCPLLAKRFGGCRSLLAPRADRSHVSASRRSLLLCMSGMLLLPPAGWVVTEAFIHLAPLTDLYRFAQTQGGSPVDMNSSWMVNVPLMALNAITEETVCAMLLVLAMRYARRPVWQIIVLAALLRVGYHLQDGPFGLTTAIFGATNAWALIRYRRVLPLIVAHFVYDTAVLFSSSLFAGHPVLTEYAPLLLCPPAIAVLLVADLAIRRRGLSPDAAAVVGAPGHEALVFVSAD